MLTPERLREVLSYHPWTGEFRWKVQASNRAPVGTVAGRVTDQGFIKIRIDGRDYLAHRLAWLHMKREWPSRLINHRNRRRTDNRWPNLRLATSSDIQAHAWPRREDMSRGVDWLRESGLYRARITVDGIKREIGKFGTEAEAYAAYLKTARKEFGEFAVA